MYLITNISKVYKSTLNHDSSAGCATGCPYRGLWFETPVRKQNAFFIEKWLVSEIASTFKTHLRLFFKNGQASFDMFWVYRYGDRSRDSQTSSSSNNSLDQRCSILFLTTYKSALYLFHVSSGDFTTVEMNAVERTLKISCSQSLARKRDSWKIESMFSEHFSSGWI